jgi:hypothetical protein
VSHSDNCIALLVTFCFQTASPDAVPPSIQAPAAPASDATATPDVATTCSTAVVATSTSSGPSNSCGSDDEDEEDSEFLNVLQYRIFSAPMEKLKDKKKITSSGRDAHEYKRCFAAVCHAL